MRSKASWSLIGLRPAAGTTGKTAYPSARRTGRLERRRLARIMPSCYRSALIVSGASHTPWRRPCPYMRYEGRGKNDEERPQSQAGIPGNALRLSFRRTVGRWPGLRLSGGGSPIGLQRLCKELGQPGENINDDIEALVADGLDPVVQQELDLALSPKIVQATSGQRP